MNTQIKNKSSKALKIIINNYIYGCRQAAKAVVSKTTIREFESLHPCVGYREITTVRPPYGERTRHDIENYIVNATAPTEGLLRHAVWRVLGTPLRQDKVDKECPTGQPPRRTSQGTPTYLKYFDRALANGWPPALGAGFLKDNAGSNPVALTIDIEKCLKEK